MRYNSPPIWRELPRGIHPCGRAADAHAPAVLQEAGASKSSSVLESVMGVLGADDSTKALHDISALSAAQTTELVRDASNWAFRLDLKERIQQVRAQELGMLEDEPHV